MVAVGFQVQVLDVCQQGVFAEMASEVLQPEALGAIEARLLLVVLLVSIKKLTQGNDAAYVKVTDTFDPNSLDFCLVDGVLRDFCALRSIDKLRPGGLLVIDNVNWYLPSGSYSPNSRTFTQGPVSPVWKDVEQRLSDWRRIWSSSGVTDTAIFFKPCC